jgi:hypothetical protein
MLFDRIACEGRRRIREVGVRIQALHRSVGIPEILAGGSRWITSIARHEFGCALGRLIVFTKPMVHRELMYC